MEYYDTKIQDIPIANNKGFKVAPHHEINRYPRLDENDVKHSIRKGCKLKPAVERNSNIEIKSQSTDGRVKHIHVKGSLVEVLSANLNELDGKQY